MPKLIAAINLTLDGICDHTAIQPDEQIHRHYAGLLRGADAILYGRITYDLMGFWKDLIRHPSGDPDLDDFAMAMDAVPKIVFSRTLKALDWDSARLATLDLPDEVASILAQARRDVFVGSRSLINQLLDLDLIDELQLCVHPVIAGSGSPLFTATSHRSEFTLLATRVFDSGAVVLSYGRR